MLRDMKTLLSALAFAAVLFSASPSRAEDEPLTTKTTWYGWQTLIADGGTLAATIVTGHPLVFAGGYTLGAPIIHWAHGNVGTGFASLGIRIVAPVVTGFAAAALAQPDVPTGRENVQALGIGFLAGGLFASVFDAAFLARSTTTIAPQRPSNAATWRVEPRVSVAPGGASAGVGGVF
jgi:hypothetical protein